MSANTSRFINTSKMEITDTILKYWKLVCEELESISLANTNICQNLIIPIIYWDMVFELITRWIQKLNY